MPPPRRRSILIHQVIRCHVETVVVIIVVAAPASRLNNSEVVPWQLEPRETNLRRSPLSRPRR